MHNRNVILLLLMLFLLILGAIASINVRQYAAHSTYWYVLWFTGVFLILASIGLGINIFFRLLNK